MSRPPTKPIFIKGIPFAICSICKELKPVAEFYGRKNRTIGISTQCKVCFKSTYQQPRVLQNRTLKRRYGITVETYEAMLSKQNGKCSICKSAVNLGRGNLAVDHCHKTKQVRGLLCFHCNTALGRIEKVGVNNFFGYIAGFYAHKYEGRNITREEAEERMPELLAYECKCPARAKKAT